MRHVESSKAALFVVALAGVAGLDCLRCWASDGTLATCCSDTLLWYLAAAVPLGGFVMAREAIERKAPDEHGLGFVAKAVGWLIVVIATVAIHFLLSRIFS